MALVLLKPDDLPTPAQESWKYTNLPRAVPSGLKPVQTPEIIIHRTRGQSGGQVEDILLMGEDGALQTPCLKIVLEEGTECTVIERHTGQGAYWKNMATEITLGANARLHHIRLQDDGGDAVHTGMVSIRLARDAVYDGFSLNVGGKLSRHQIHAELIGPNAEISLNGLNLLGGEQHGDTTILIEHAAPHCRSNQFYRTLLKDRARGVFQGKVHVHRVAQKTDGYQMSNALLLSPDCEMDTKPELEIYADDVKCSHGSTTGQLDEAPLFYLRSRGLSEQEARLLLVQAFVGEVVDKVPEAQRHDIESKVEQWLRSAL